MSLLRQLSLVSRFSKKCVLQIVLLLVFLRVMWPRPPSVAEDAEDKLASKDPSLDDLTTLTLSMPGVTSNSTEPMLCTYLEVPMDEAYVVQMEAIEPVADSIHHVMIYGCSHLQRPKVWRCDVDKNTDNDPQFQTRAICSKNKLILYGWDVRPMRFRLPDDTGYAVGRQTSLRYLVLAVHFQRRIQEPDFTGVRVRVTDKVPSRRVGAFKLLGNTPIQPKSVTYADFLCHPLNAPSRTLSFVPFRFSPHTHHHGRVVAGYKVDTVTGQWSLIGKQAPRQVDVSYPVEEPLLTVTEKDLLAVRCTMVNSDDHVIQMGSENHDEMCIFYMMYFYTGTSPYHSAKTYNCLPPSSEEQKKYIFPREASEIGGVYYKEGPLD